MTCLKLYIKIFCVCIDGGWHPTPLLLPGKSHGWRSLVGCSPWVAKSWPRLSDFTSTFHFHALEKEMATHSSVLAWRVPGTGKPGGLPSLGLHRVGHDWSDLAVLLLIQQSAFCLECLYIISERNCCQINVWSKKWMWDLCFMTTEKLPSSINADCEYQKCSVEWLLCSEKI